MSCVLHFLDRKYLVSTNLTICEIPQNTSIKSYQKGNVRQPVYLIASAMFLGRPGQSSDFP